MTTKPTADLRAAAERVRDCCGTVIDLENAPSQFLNDIWHLACATIQSLADNPADDAEPVTPSMHEQLRRLAAQNPPSSEWLDVDELCPFVAD